MNPHLADLLNPHLAAGLADVTRHIWHSLSGSLSGSHTRHHLTGQLPGSGSLSGSLSHRDRAALSDHPRIGTEPDRTIQT